MKRLSLIILLISYFAFMPIMGCKITWAPSPDAIIAQKEVTAKQDCYAMYSKMIGSLDKKFDTYASDYSQVEAELFTIEQLTKIRHKPNDILVIVENIINSFKIYENEHKDKITLNNGQLKIFQKYMDDFFTPLLNSENSLK